MRKIKIYVLKLLIFILNLLGRGGSLPGDLWLRYDKDVLKTLQYPNKIILVTGTNGKTTTTNLIYNIFKLEYNKVICNDKGDNMLRGVATLILKNLKGNKVDADVLILEIDELSMPKIIDNLGSNVSDVVILNFFRDQLDRAGEMEKIIKVFENTFNDYTGKLLLNGSDPNVVRLSKIATKAQIETFEVVIDKENIKEELEAKEGRFCPFCNSELQYEYYLYAHIGKFKCSGCDFNNYTNDNIIKFHNDKIYYNDNEYDIENKSLYAIYNYAAVLSITNNCKYNNINKIVSSFKVNKGRNETFKFTNHEVILNLVKNPTGTNEVLKEIAKDTRSKNIVFILNDYENDGRDVSWIYDTKIEYLTNANVKEIMCSGLRAYDFALRVKYEDIDYNIDINYDYKEAINKYDNSEEVLYVLSVYSNIVKTRSYLERKSI